MRRSVLLLALLTACSKGDDAPVDTDTDTVVETDGDTAAPVDTDCSDDVPTDGAGLAVTATDVDGAPLGADRIQLRYCRGEQCVTEQCVQAGVHRIGGLTSGIGSLELFPKPVDGEAPLATPFVPFTVTEGEVATLTVVVPPTGAPVELTVDTQEHEVATGLYLTLKQGDVDGSTPLAPDPTEISGVDATDVAAPIEGLPGEVLAVWYLEPFDAPAAATASIRVRVDDRWSLGSGNGTLYAGSYLNAAWQEVGVLVEDDGKLAVTGLPRLTTLVVVRNPAP